MSAPDRIDIIAAAALQGYLAQWPLNVPRPVGQTMDELARWALEMGKLYHALREPQSTRADANVIPIGPLGNLKAGDVMGCVS